MNGNQKYRSNFRPRIATALASIGLFILIFRPSTHAAGMAGLQTLTGHVPAAATGLKPIDQLPGTNLLRLAIGLPLCDPAGLSNFLRELYDPASPAYRKYLTPQEFTARFGPGEQDYQTLIQFAKTNNLTVTTQHPNRVILDVTGAVGDIEKAFHTTLKVYQHPTEDRKFYAPETEPSLDLTTHVLHVSGLENYWRARLRYQARKSGKSAKGRPHVGTGSGPTGNFRGNDFRAAYAPGTTLTGIGQAVGLLEFDGYDANDINYYETASGLPNVPLQNVLLDGSDGSLNGDELEVSLDIEMIASMAPGVAQIIVYEAGPSGVWHDILNRMATDNLAKQLSCSWYIPDGPADAVADQIFQQMAAQGQSFYNASGDSDAYTGLIDFPGDTPYITQVGGTTLTTAGPGGAWVTERSWNDGYIPGDDGIGSGGGVSTYYSIPSWQAPIAMTANHGSTTMRNTPDVALTADDVYVRVDGEDELDVRGTSCAAPLWAAFSALANQQAAANGRPTIGFINPVLTTIGLGTGFDAAFHDTTAGSNTWSGSPTLFYAVPGYDLCTGWGTPTGAALINALAGPPDALDITPGTGFSASGGAGGPFDLTWENFALTNTGTTPLTWSLANTSAWLQVSSTGGALSPGDPATVIAFSLNSAASNLVAGNYTATVWFTNLSDGIGQSRSFSLAVLGAPVINQQPVTQTVFAGTTTSFTVGVTGLSPLSYQWRFNGDNLAGATNPTLNLPSVTVAQGGGYDVVLSNPLGQATSSVAVLTVIPVAANDQCASAITITVDNYSHSQSTTNATSIGDPSPDCIGGFGNGVWYQYTPAASGQMVVSTIGSDFDTGLALYSGSCGALTQLACDDDFGSQLTSEISYPVTAGTTYFVLAGGYAGHKGNLSFHLTFTGAGGTGNNLVQNPGFETGDFSGWGGTMAGATVAFGGSYVHSGSYGARLGPVGGLGYLSQVLPTTAGASYLVSFWIDNPSGGIPNEFQAKWDGGVIYDGVNLSAIGWTHLQYLVTASTTSTTLQFGFRQDPSYLGLDDISVTLSNAVVNLPRPTLQLAVSGNLLVIFWTATNQTYQLESSTTLLPATWLPVSSPPIPIGDQLVVPILPAGTRSFYRLRGTGP